MKTTEDLRTRIKELSKQAVEYRKEASEIYESNAQEAQSLREQAREALKRCEILRQEIKRTQNAS
ncbi:hypothetical protein NIES4071_31800 [Calothrix sp. NIES-4071]|nr:hypothetical protein NIES4071_31800 [Calothrix sp. NIES-4071]BAZ57500.1 hypothetical protein NIES4105_31740 [Calothrix sp. NIES-4105]